MIIMMFRFPVMINTLVVQVKEHEVAIKDPSYKPRSEINSSESVIWYGDLQLLFGQFLVRHV